MRKSQDRREASTRLSRDKILTDNTAESDAAHQLSQQVREEIWQLHERINNLEAENQQLMAQRESLEAQVMAFATYTEPSAPPWEWEFPYRHWPNQGGEDNAAA